MTLHHHNRNKAAPESEASADVVARILAGQCIEMQPAFSGLMRSSSGTPPSPGPAPPYHDPHLKRRSNCASSDEPAHGSSRG